MRVSPIPTPASPSHHNPGKRMRNFRYWKCSIVFHSQSGNTELHIFIGNSIFHLSLELLAKFWKMSLKVA